MNKRNYLLGILVTILIAMIAFVDPAFFNTFESKLVDWRFSVRGQAQHNNDVVVVTIDDRSLSKLGKWPWKRSVQAKLVDVLNEAGAKVIAFDVYFQRNGDKPLTIADKKFIESLQKSGNVILPIYFNLNQQEIVNEENAKSEKIGYDLVSNQEAIDDIILIEGYDLFSSYPELNKAAYGLGHINFVPDEDGIARKEIFVVKYDGKYYPSLSLRAIQKFYDENNTNLELVGDEGIYIGKKYIHLEPNPMAGALVWGIKNVNYRGSYKTFKYYSVIDVLNHRFPSNAFNNKIVLIGATSPGLYDIISTPFSNIFPGVERHANVIDNIINNDFITRPFYTDLFSILICLFFGLVLSFVIPLIKLTYQLVVPIALTVVYIIFSCFVFSKYAMWLNMVYPIFTIWFVSLAIIFSMYLKTKKEHSEAVDTSYDAIKMLGISYQEKGMLEMAYENFQKLPLNEETMRLQYSLANELRRKRKDTLAIQIYKKLYEKDKKFEDVAYRLTDMGVSAVKIKQKGHSRTLTFIDDSTQAHKDEELKKGQTLGRYEVEKVLGQGAMGTVYLAKDPTLDRFVALKTVNFTTLVDESKIEKVKESFIKEARLAGKMNHPNIVIIYDAGHDWDLTYIAMEVLKGVELKDYCSVNNLFPEHKVIELISNLALALNYAQGNGIIHRDIKPANIMLLEDGTPKITDFGIALAKGEIAKVAGTPSYMAPEQFTGQDVDGRTDLYALGIVLYEMITGTKPFRGKTIAALKQKILNSPVPEPIKTDGVVAKDISDIIMKMLEKKKENRFNNGKEVAEALKKIKKSEGQESTIGSAGADATIDADVDATVDSDIDDATVDLSNASDAGSTNALDDDNDATIVISPKKPPKDKKPKSDDADSDDETVYL